MKNWILKWGKFTIIDDSSTMTTSKENILGIMMVMDITIILQHLNSFLNPILYSFRVKRVKNSLNNLFNRQTARNHFQIWIHSFLKLYITFISSKTISTCFKPIINLLLKHKCVWILFFDYLQKAWWKM